MKESATAACAGCGDPLTPRKSPGGYTKKWCSMACRSRTNYRNSAEIRARQSELKARHYRETYIPSSHTLICTQCGSGFQARNSNTLYCTALCRSRAFTAARKADGRSKAYRVANAERILEYAIEYNPKYRATEAGKQAAQAGVDKRRALLNGCETEHFTHIEIFERDGWICGLCRIPVDPDLAYPDPMSKSLDHIVALTRGGGHLRSNTQLAHLVCNVSKGNRAA